MAGRIFVGSKKGGGKGFISDWGSEMFFEVKIYDADGELKRVVSPKKLSKNFWKESTNGLPDFSETYVSQDAWETKNAWDKVQMEDPGV